MDESNGVFISELLSNVLTSTLQAEQQGYEQYLAILEEMEAMGNVGFSYRDEDGIEQRLDVPVLTLVPLTMLHIEEATFDFSLKVSELGSTSTSGQKQEAPSLSQQATDAAADGQPTNEPIGKARAKLTEIQKNLKESIEARVIQRKELTTRNFKRLTGGMQVSVTSQDAETTNLKVTVEMGQTDLTAGLIAMLQRKNNSINE